MIHEEAAGASTREQRQLQSTIEGTGGRRVIVGDPQQSKPVGAGGRWPQIEQLLSQGGARVALSTNIRALNPADRRDKKLFRDGQVLDAAHRYADRGRVHIDSDQEAVENRDCSRKRSIGLSGRRTRESCILRVTPNRPTPLIPRADAGTRTPDPFITSESAGAVRSRSSRVNACKLDISA